MSTKMTKNNMIQSMGKWILIVMLCLVISGCGHMATMNSFDRRAAVCTSAILVGAIAGGALGGKKGIAYGAGAGAVACALFAALDPYDKQRIKQTQVNAVTTNKPRHDSWVGKDGKQRVVTVNSPLPVTVKQHSNQICRKISTAVQVGGQTDCENDIYCRNQNGDWYPMPPMVASN